MADRTKPRWYHPTPDRLILALLVVQCLLWLSQRFQWFGFNHHKGWTVLIAVAAVGATMLVMLLWFIGGLLFRWRFQFRIRSLLIFTVVVAIPCSWLAAQMKKAREQKAAVVAIAKHVRAMGSAYDYEFDASGNYLPNARPPAPVWLQSLLGDDFFGQVESLTFWGPQLTNADLEHLGALNKLRLLYLFSTDATDAGLEHLKVLDQLQYLHIEAAQVTDAGVEKLQQALPKCRILHFQ
jgi:hypothetical protein